MQKVNVWGWVSKSHVNTLSLYIYIEEYNIHSCGLKVSVLLDAVTNSNKSYIECHRF